MVKSIQETKDEHILIKTTASTVTKSYKNCKYLKRTFGSLRGITF